MCVTWRVLQKLVPLFKHLFMLRCLTSFPLRVVCVGRWETIRGIEEETIVNLFKYGRRPSKHQILPMCPPMLLQEIYDYTTDISNHLQVYLLVLVWSTSYAKNPGKHKCTLDLFYFPHSVISTH